MNFFSHQIGREVFEAARARLVRRKGLFELLGLDFMLDSTLAPWLLEVETWQLCWKYRGTSLIRNSTSS